jgi:hypothetical protein
MFEAGSSDEVAKRLEMLFKKGEDDDVPLGDGHSRLSQYSWAQQTKLLEDVMLSAVEVLR